MELNTKYFGRVSYQPNESVCFPEGLFGYEEYKDYLPIAFRPGSDSLLSLQSIQEESLAFTLMNPFELLEGYHPILSPADLLAIGAAEENDLSYYVICTARETAAKSTVNLKCPIVVNTISRVARQVILDTEIYSFRHSLSDLCGKGAVSC